MDDTISRQSALNALGSITMYKGVISVDTAMAKIMQLPSAEPKRGWWIEIINSRGVVVALRCSRCEKSPRHGVRSDFCPNCGADMRQREE